MSYSYDVDFYFKKPKLKTCRLNKYITGYENENLIGKFLYNKNLKVYRKTENIYSYRFYSYETLFMLKDVFHQFFYRRPFIYFFNLLKKNINIDKMSTFLLNELHFLKVNFIIINDIFKEYYINIQDHISNYIQAITKGEINNDLFLYEKRKLNKKKKLIKRFFYFFCNIDVKDIEKIDEFLIDEFFFNYKLKYPKLKKNKDYYDTLNYYRYKKKVRSSFRLQERKSILVN